MKNLFKNFIAAIAAPFLVDILKRESRKTTNTVDDQLVDMVEKAIEGKSYEDMVASTKKEVARAKAKVEEVKDAVDEIVDTVKGKKKSKK